MPPHLLPCSAGGAEGRLEEALTWGRRGAQSYSATGLIGLATALEANHQGEEARSVWRAAAHRYHVLSDDFVKFLFRNKYPTDVVHAEIESLLAAHAARKDLVAYFVSLAFAREGRTGGLLEVYKGPLAFLAADERTQWLLLSALAGRRYDDARRYSRELAHLRPLQSHEALWTYAAGALARNAEAVEEARKELARFRGDRLFRWHARFARGEITAEELINSIWLDEHSVYANLLIGVAAEVRGDTEEALTAYRKAAHGRGSTKGPALCAEWLSRLSPPSTRPAAATPDGQQ